MKKHGLMKRKQNFTGERILGDDPSMHDLWIRHIKAYDMATALIETLNLWKNNLNILEVGIGAGYGISMLAKQQPSNSYFGTDVAMPSLSEDTRTDRIRIHTFQSSATCLPIQDNSIDLIISFQVIEHILDDKAAIMEFNRILKPGGVLLLSTPRKNALGADPDLWNPFHIREYDLIGLQYLISSFFGEHFFYGLSASEKYFRRWCFPFNLRSVVRRCLDFVLPLGTRQSPMRAYAYRKLIAVIYKSGLAYIFHRIQRIETPNHFNENDYWFDWNGNCDYYPNIDLFVLAWKPSLAFREYTLSNIFNRLKYADENPNIKRDHLD